MNWRQLTSKLADVSQSDAVIVAKILDYYPYSAASRLDELDLPFARQHEILFAVLLKLYLHLQQGNTRLPLHNIQNMVLFESNIFDNDVQQDSGKSGIKLPTLSDIKQILATWLGLHKASQPFVLQDEYLYIERYFNYEKEVAALIKSFQFSIETQVDEDSKTLFNTLFSNTDAETSAPTSKQTHAQINWQAVATASALTQNFMVLNGGPGTGKTYTVARIMVMLQKMHPELIVQLAAPTGKAAQRLSESLQKAIAQLSEHAQLKPYLAHIATEAVTLHRLVGANVGKTQTAKHQQRPLKCGLLIIDEFSMVDIAMFTKVLRACRPNTRIILVGDTAQLPSVQAGNLLSDLCLNTHPHKSFTAATFIEAISGFQVPSSHDKYSDFVVTLAENHRSDLNIIKLASDVMNNDVESVASRLGADSILSDDIDESVYRKILDQKLSANIDNYAAALTQAKSATDMLDYLKQSKILSPIRKGRYGVEGLNQAMIDHLCKQQKMNKTHGLFHGMAIIISENDYTSGLSNGDVGIIWNVSTGQNPDTDIATNSDNSKNNTDNEPRQLMAFVERENAPAMQLSTHRLPKFEPAFALTIHKTQGSEFDNVQIIMPFKPTQGCSRELLYTGVTRAKTAIDILSTLDTLTDSLARSNKRDTYLGELLA